MHDDHWYLLEFTIQTADGRRHVRSEWRPTRTEAAILMHREVAMGEWDTWQMTRWPLAGPGVEGPS